MNGGNFTKLFASIITSTIWREADYVRCVWVTMLAICDRYGNVRASVPGLAAVANVSIDHCLEAIDKFLSPDPWSRTKAYDGRRIEVIEGGWRLLNYEAHRDGPGEDSGEVVMTPGAIRARRFRRNHRDDVTERYDDVIPSASASPSVDESVNTEKKKDSNHGESDRVTRFMNAHDFGRWHPTVEGYLRRSPKAHAVMAELELWIAGELNRRATDAVTLGEALNAYDAATDPREGFKTNYFGGFVRGVHRGRDRNDNSRRNTTEDASIREEARAAEERRQEEADARMVRTFAEANPDRANELQTIAEADVTRQGKMTDRTRAILIHAKLVELVRREMNGA